MSMIFRKHNPRTNEHKRWENIRRGKPNHTTVKLNVLVEPRDTVEPVSTDVEPIVPVPTVPDVTEPAIEQTQEESTHKLCLFQIL